MNTKPNIGETIVLRKVPPGLLQGLPNEDQVAILSAIGKPVTVVGYNDRGEAVLEFSHCGDIHNIWIDITVATTVDYDALMVELVEAADERIELISSMVPRGFQSKAQVASDFRERILASNERYEAAKRAVKLALVGTGSPLHDRIK